MDEATYEEVVGLWRKERRRPALAPIGEALWERTRHTLNRIQEDLQQVMESDPEGMKAAMLRNEMEGLRRACDDLYDLRERKITQLAMSRAQGGNPECENLTPDEEILLHNLATALKHHRTAIRDAAEARIAEAATQGA